MSKKADMKVYKGKEKITVKQIFNTKYICTECGEQKIVGFTCKSRFCNRCGKVYNPHIHALVKEGALDRYNVWKSVGYIPYEYLRKAWQKVFLDLMKEKYGHETKMVEREYTTVIY